MLLAGLVGCGDDDGGGGSAVDAGSDGSTGHEPDMDGGRHPTPKPDASEPDPDAGGHEPKPDASEPDPDAGEPDPDAGVDGGGPFSLGGLTVTRTPEELDEDLDLFGVPGHRFWIEVNDEQLTKLNNGDQGGCGPFCGGDIYTPGSSTSNAFYADHVLVQDAESKAVADYGKVEIDLVGQSTRRQWDKNQIPNVRIDTNEFDKDTRIGTFEHMRLNNSLVGSIFREALAHDIYRALDYPALRSSHVFLGSNVWGEDIWVPMTLMEMYKKRFCKDNEELIGGSCDNMWEFVGDLDGGYGYPGPGLPMGAPADPGAMVPRDWCQVSECDNTRLGEAMIAIGQAQQGDGFQEAVEDYVDWDRYHQFQCLSWIMWVGDDPIHGGNNTLIYERDTDHKLIYAPYSVDISAGQDWYTNVELKGQTRLAVGCQSDADCWAETIATCEDLIMRFDELNPEEMVDDLVTTLTDLEMMRYGDEDRAEQLRAWFVWRQEVLADELETYRYLPDEYGNCPGDTIRCGDGACGTVEDCEERMCRVGYEICESSGQCYDPRYPYQCPSCTDEAPYYCSLTNSCEADVDACANACNEYGDPYVWCEAQAMCLEYYYCQDESDGGAGTGGGVGGFAGFGMGGFPGGFAGVGGMVAPPPIAGDGVIIDPL